MGVTFHRNRGSRSEENKGVTLLRNFQPGPNFREDFDRYPVLFTGLERALCPRVHFKIIVFDCEMAYVGSANLTGAGIGMKSCTAAAGASPYCSLRPNSRDGGDD